MLTRRVCSSVRVAGFVYQATAGLDGLPGMKRLLEAAALEAREVSCCGGGVGCNGGTSNALSLFQS